MYDVALGADAIAQGQARTSTSLANPPFTAGKVVSTTFRLFGRHAARFCLAAAIFFSPAILFDLATGAGNDVSNLSNVIWYGLGCILTAAVARGALDALEGRPVRMAALLRAGPVSGFQVLGATMLVGLITLLGLVLLVVPGLVAFAGLYVAGPAVVAEPGTSARHSIERSWHLTRGHRWATLGISLLFLAIPIAVTTAAGALTLLLDGAWTSRAAALAVNLLLASTQAIPAVATTVAYHDLRIEKEGVPTSALVAVFE